MKLYIDKGIRLHKRLNKAAIEKLRSFSIYLTKSLKKINLPVKEDVQDLLNLLRKVCPHRVEALWYHYNLYRKEINKEL